MYNIYIFIHTYIYIFIFIIFIYTYILEPVPWQLQLDRKKSVATEFTRLGKRLKDLWTLQNLCWNYEHLVKEWLVTLPYFTTKKMLLMLQWGNHLQSQVSSDQNRGSSSCIWGIILPSYIGIITSHYKDPHYVNRVLKVAQVKVSPVKISYSAIFSFVPPYGTGTGPRLNWGALLQAPQQFAVIGMMVLDANANG